MNYAFAAHFSFFFAPASSVNWLLLFLRQKLQLFRTRLRKLSRLRNSSEDSGCFRRRRAEAASLQPDMRAFVLWKIAEGYRKSSPSKLDQPLRDALTASLSIEDIAPESPGGFCPDMQGCGIKTWLQRSILLAMTSLSDQEALLPKAQPEVQKQVTAQLIPRYIAKKDLERARQLIASLGEQDAYPYGSAMDLMMALPRGSALEKVAIFSEAVMLIRGRVSHNRTVQPTMICLAW